MDKKILINTLWVSGEKFVRLPLSFVINIYLIQYLGAEDYGSYVFYMVVVGLLVPLSSFGMDAFLVKESVGAPAIDQNKIFLNGLVVRMMGSLAGFFIAIMVIFVDDSALWGLGLLMALALLIESFTVGHYKLLAEEKFVKISIIEFVAFIFGFFGRCAFLVFDLPIIYLGASYVLEFFIRSVCFFWFSADDLFTIKNVFESKRIKNYILVGKKLVVLGLLVAALTKIDQLMIYFLLGDKSIGIYSAALRFVEPLLLAIVVFNEVIFPRMLHFRKQGKLQYLDFIWRVLFANFFGALLIYGVVSLVAPQIIVHMLGDEFTIAANLYPILALLIPVLSLVFFIDKCLQAESMHNLNRNRIIVSFVINVPLNFLLIEMYGITGAAIATIISYLLGLLVLLFNQSFRNIFVRVSI